MTAFNPVIHDMHADPVPLANFIDGDIAALVSIIREQKLQHVVMPLMAADFAWSARHLHAPASRLFLESTL